MRDGVRVCVTDLSGSIVDCNTTFAGIVGWKRTELAGHNIGELYERRNDRDELMSLLRDAQSLNGVEVEMRRTDGQRVWILQNLALVVSERPVSARRRRARSSCCRGRA